MAGEKAEKLFKVAAISFKGFFRKPPLPAKMRRPVKRRLPKVRRGGDEKFVVGIQPA